MAKPRHERAFRSRISSKGALTGNDPESIGMSTSACRPELPPAAEVPRTRPGNAFGNGPRAAEVPLHCLTLGS